MARSYLLPILAHSTSNCTGLVPAWTRRERKRGWRKNRTLIVPSCSRSQTGKEFAAGKYNKFSNGASAECHTVSDCLSTTATHRPHSTPAQPNFFPTHSPKPHAVAEAAGRDRNWRRDTKRQVDGRYSSLSTTGVGTRLLTRIGNWNRVFNVICGVDYKYVLGGWLTT